MKPFKTGYGGGPLHLKLFNYWFIFELFSIKIVLGISLKTKLMETYNRQNKLSLR